MERQTASVRASVAKKSSLSNTSFEVFKDAIQMALSYKKNSNDFMDEVMRELENFDLEAKEESSDKEEETQERQTESA